MTLFASYEREGLEIDNVWHIFTLKYMFMPRIQKQLNEFKSNWNNHPLESEHNCTPLQLILIRNNEKNYIDPLDLEPFGVEGKIDNEYNEEDVQAVCLTIHPLSPDNLTILKDEISPLTKDIPQHNLTDRFQFALTIVLDMKDVQILQGN
jgi:hypothetical protein